MTRPLECFDAPMTNDTASVCLGSDIREIPSDVTGQLICCNLWDSERYLTGLSFMLLIYQFLIYIRLRKVVFSVNILSLKLIKFE